jgi:triacylglycerol lipase
LEQHGARIFVGNQDAWGSFEDNALQIAETLQGIINSTGCGKVNIIAHSKGGIDSRRLIALPGRAEQIASLTTISSPHHGSKTLGWLCRWLRPAMWLISWPVNLWFRLRGDKHSDFYPVCKSLAPAEMAEFNQEYPPCPGILYRHYAAAMRSSSSDIFSSLTHAIVRLADGENDGIVATASSRYGGQGFKGVLCSASRRGVSHIDVIDCRRRPLTGRRQPTGRGPLTSQGYDKAAVASGSKAALGKEQPAASAPAAAATIAGDSSNDSIPVTDIIDFYIDIVRELRGLGL